MTTPASAREFFVGVQLSPLRISASLFDRTWRVHGKIKRSTKAIRGGDLVIGRVVRSIADVVDEADLGLENVTAVGIALCSEFSPEFASVDRPLAAHWKERWPLPLLQEQLKVPVHLLSVGAAATLGVSAGEAGKNDARLAVLWIEAELAAGVLSEGELKEGAEATVLGEDRWLDWGKCLRSVPGKKRYKKMRSLLYAKDGEALERFEGVISQVSRALGRCLDHYAPDVIALVGGGAEELKDELLQGIATADPALWERLATAGCMIPAMGTNACQLGAAIFAARSTPGAPGRKRGRE